MRVARVTKSVLLLALSALLLLPAVADAVLSGANGRIAYVSGRGYGDSKAQLYLRIASGSTGFGLNSGPFGLATNQQSRHPTWSPDRTKIAYARGEGFCPPADCDIYIIDLTAPLPFPQKLTNTPTVNEDRPAWSPDGTRLAYESEVGAQQDILVHNFATGTKVNLTNESAAIENKPAWTPDSQTIYYAYDSNKDIFKEPADNSQNAGTPVLNSGTGEFQPSLSPDGTKMCYTRGTNGSNEADVYVVNSDGSGAPGIDLSQNPGVGDYNCTWSPTGLQIAYVRGIFGAGDLYIEDSDNTSFPLAVEAIPAPAFDGNPDWAPDGRPECEDVSASTKVNQPVTIELECFDTGPFYERSLVREFAGEPKMAQTAKSSRATRGHRRSSTRRTKDSWARTNSGSCTSTRSPASVRKRP